MNSMKFTKKQRIFELKEAMIYVTVLSAIILGAVYYSSNLELIGFILVGLSILPLIALRMTAEKIREGISEIVFGAVNTGLITLMALGGYQLEGILGAVIGVAVGDAVTEGFSGILGGEVTEMLMKRGIKEKIDPLISSLGKMAGALLGGGIVLLIFSFI